MCELGIAHTVGKETILIHQTAAVACTAPAFFCTKLGGRYQYGDKPKRNHLGICQARVIWPSFLAPSILVWVPDTSRTNRNPMAGDPHHCRHLDDYFLMEVDLLERVQRRTQNASGLPMKRRTVNDHVEIGSLLAN